MVTFLTIVFILVCINAAIMLTSLYVVYKRENKVQKSITDSTISKIYPLDLFASTYKKAV